jgi:hypothetical protein
MYKLLNCKGRSFAPRSYCATSWEGKKSIACSKLVNQDDDQECVCQQNFCNWPYARLPSLAKLTTVGKKLPPLTTMEAITTIMPIIITRPAIPEMPTTTAIPEAKTTELIDTSTSLGRFLNWK